MRLEAVNVSFRYTAKTAYVLKNLFFSIEEGERVGVVAPSGYGKTTFVKLLAGYERPTEGSVLLDGAPLATKGALPIQLIGQHPEQAINPRWKMRRVLEEAGQLDEAVLEAMGIERAWLSRYPRELSGGELQRFCVARALCADTRFLLADEMSTMLDVITQAQLWKYLLEEAERRHIGVIAVTHNPALAERVCDRVVDLRQINGRML
jgi:peptide/nickel transport system ATP-binding protein